MLFISGTEKGSDLLCALITPLKPIKRNRQSAFFRILNTMSETLRAIPATVEPDGTVRLSQSLHLAHRAQAVLTIMIESDGGDLAQVSENVLGKDWNRSEEDEAWSALQAGK